MIWGNTMKYIFFLWISCVHPCRNTNLWRSLVIACWPKSESWMSCLASWMQRWNKMSPAHTMKESTSSWLRQKHFLWDNLCPLFFSVWNYGLHSWTSLVGKRKQICPSGPRSPSRAPWPFLKSSSKRWRWQSSKSVTCRVGSVIHRRSQGSPSQTADVELMLELFCLLYWEGSYQI